MKIVVTAKLAIENKPIEINATMEFEKGEYVEVIKALPDVLKQVRKLALDEAAIKSRTFSRTDS